MRALMTAAHWKRVKSTCRTMLQPHAGPGRAARRKGRSTCAHPADRARCAPIPQMAGPTCAPIVHRREATPSCHGIPPRECFTRRAESDMQATSGGACPKSVPSLNQLHRGARGGGGGRGGYPRSPSGNNTVSGVCSQSPPPGGGGVAGSAGSPFDEIKSSEDFSRTASSSVSMGHLQAAGGKGHGGCAHADGAEGAYDICYHLKLLSPQRHRPLSG